MAETSPRKISFIVSKGSLDMAYIPMIVGNAARMSGVDVNIFFTFWGLDIVTKKKMNRLHVATVGNPAMHPAFHIPTLVGLIPGMSHMASWMMRREIAKWILPPMVNSSNCCRTLEPNSTAANDHGYVRFDQGRPGRRR